MFLCFTQRQYRMILTLCRLCLASGFRAEKCHSFVLCLWRVRSRINRLSSLMYRLCAFPILSFLSYLSYPVFSCCAYAIFPIVSSYPTYPIFPFDLLYPIYPMLSYPIILSFLSYLSHLSYPLFQSHVNKYFNIMFLLMYQSDIKFECALPILGT